MAQTDPNSALHTPRPPTRPQRRHGITPVFALLLFETMRDLDRPMEVLEDEVLSVSLPRRFGLSDVVGRQIHRFGEEVKQRRLQSVAEMEDLIRLVARRPDAAEIFREAGQRMAARAWDERTTATRRVLPWMPRPVALLSAVRAAGRLFRQLVGDGRLRIQRRPVEMHVAGSITARADPTGAACAFYSGALEELLTRHTGRAYQVLHERCEAHSDTTCEWTVRVRG
jgi:bacteriochlorophyll 4-vinyl reductase